MRGICSGKSIVVSVSSGFFFCWVCLLIFLMGWTDIKWGNNELRVFKKCGDILGILIGFRVVVCEFSNFKMSEKPIG